MRRRAEKARPSGAGDDASPPRRPVGDGPAPGEGGVEAVAMGPIPQRTAVRAQMTNLAVEGEKRLSRWLPDGIVVSWSDE